MLSNQVQRKLAPLSVGICGTFDATWSNVTLSGGKDTVASGKCVQYQLVSTNNAGRATTTGPTGIVKVDTTAPTGGAISVTAGFNTTGTVPVSVTNASDPESGILSNQVQRKLAPLSGGTCGTFDATWSNVSLSGGNDTVMTGNCVQYRLVSTDNAGLSTTTGPTGIVQVSTSPPSLSLVESASDQFDYVSGSTVFYNPASGHSGAFTVTATTSDPASGIDHVAFPNVFSSSDGASIAVSPYARTYSWSGTASASGAKTVSSYNGAGLHTDKQFTVTVDTTAPSGGSVSYGNGYNTTGSVPVSFTAAIDSGSGIASNQLQRQLGALSGGTCDFTTSSPPWTNVSAGNDTVASGKCVRYRLVATDHVSNQGIFTSPNVVKVDTSAPAGGAISVTPGLQQQPDRHRPGVGHERDRSAVGDPFEPGAAQAGVALGRLLRDL